MRPVQAQPVAHLAAQELPHGCVEHLAADVPESSVDAVEDAQVAVAARTQSVVESTARLGRQRLCSDRPAIDRR